MKKTIIACAAVVAIAAASCGKSGGSSSNNANEALYDSVAMYMGKAQGAMLNQNLSTLDPSELAKFKKESFLRGFKSVLMADTGDVGYQYGVQIGLGFARQLEMMARDSVNINREDLYRYFAEAFKKDSVNQVTMGMDMNVLEGLMGRVSSIIRERQMAESEAKREADAALAAENQKKGSEFVENAKKEDATITTTESGLSYKILTKGTGATPTEKDAVKVHYTGKLIDGTVFDSSVERGEPAVFTITQVVPGFAEGLKMMNKGSKYVLYIPSNLAYGDNTNGEIPAGSTLIFEVEVLDITPNK